VSTRPDIPSLVAGVAIAALGVVLLLDASTSFELRFEVMAPLVTAALGAILLSLGLSRTR
jgi:hypothetical protein